MAKKTGSTPKAIPKSIPTETKGDAVRGQVPRMRNPPPPPPKRND